MNGQAKITEVYCLIVRDADGTEGVPAVQIGDLVLPGYTSDPKYVENLKAIAVRMKGHAVTLARFTNREDIEKIEP